MTIIQDTPHDRRHPTEGFDVTRPTWADETHINDDLNSARITHVWAAPIRAHGVIGSDEQSTALTVQLSQIDDLKVTEAWIRYDLGHARVFLADLDTSFEDTAEARRFAAAIVAACDRLDGAA